MTGISRDLLVKILEAENIIARRYFYPGCHKMEPYRSFFPHAGLLLTETQKVSQQVVLLPTGTSICKEYIHKIIQIIRISIFNSQAINEQSYSQCDLS